LAASTSLTCTHEGAFPFGVVVTQGGTEYVRPLGVAEMANAHPSVIITAPTAGSSFAAQTTINVAATFDEGPTPGPHTCAISWGDDSVTAGTIGAGTCTGSHVYASGATGPREIMVAAIDPGFTTGIASVTIVVTSPAATTCVRRPGQTCTVAGIGTVGRQAAFELTAGIRNAQPIGQMLLIDGNWRFLTVAIRALSISGERGTFAGTGSLNGRPGYAFEATVVDNRRLLGRGGSPDTLRVVVRDAAGTIVRVVDGEVTRGDLVVD
jgi:large repetitive protein